MRRTVTQTAWLLALIGCTETEPQAMEYATSTAGPTTPLTTVEPLPEVCINELMPANKGSLTLPDGTTPDWIELAVRDGSADLDGWFLVNDAGTPERYSLSGLSVNPDEPLLLFASETSDDGGFPWKLDALGERVGLVDPTGDTLWVEWSTVADDSALFRTTDCCSGPDCWAQQLHGSPGFPNN